MSNARRIAIALLVSSTAMMAAASSASAATYRQLVSGHAALRGYWPLGDAFGGTVATAVKGPNGTYVNAPRLGDPGLMRNGGDKAVWFSEAANSYVSVPDAPALDVTTALTLEAWVKYDAYLSGGQYGTILGKGDAYSLDVNDGRWVFWSRAAGVWKRIDFPRYTSLANVEHVALTYDGTNAKLYVDGKLESTKPAAGFNPDVTAQSAFVGGWWGAGLTGVVDEAAIYGAALTAAEVAEHYETGIDDVPPTAPAGVKATAGDREVTLDWDGSSQDVATYRVFRKTGTAAYAQVGGDLTDPTYTDTTVANGTAYSYVVRAIDAHGGVSPDSAPVTATPAAATKYRDLVAGHEALQGYWRLAEGAGATSATAVRGSSASIAGAPAGLGAAGLIAKDSNAALDLDGLDDRLSVPDSEALDATDAVSAEAWVRADAALTATRYVACKGTAYCLSVGADGTPQFSVTAGLSTVAARWTSPLAVGSRYHLAGTYGGGFVRLYVNGAKVAEAALSGTVQQSGNVLSLGGYDGTAVGAWNGVIDEPAVYDAALSAAEVKSHHDVGTQGSPPAAPAAVTAVAGDGQVSLDWADNAEADLEGYDVYRTTLPGGGAYAKVNQRRLKGSKLTDFTAANGYAYRYVVKATNTLGRTSAASTAANASPKAPNGYRDVVAATSSLRAYWRLGEPRGDIGEAVKGPEVHYKNNPTLGRPSLLVSDPDTSFAPNRVAGTYARSPEQNGAFDVSTAWSLEAWIKPTAWYDGVETTGSIVGRGNSYSLELGKTGKVGVCVMSAGAWNCPEHTQLALNTTYHLAATYDGVNVRLYVNGALAGTTPAGAADMTDHDMTIGSWWSETQFTGDIDEVALYDAPLSAAAVKEHYDLGADNTPPAKPTGLTATNGDGQVALDWSDNAESDLAHYDVLRGTTAGGPYAKVASKLTVSAFTDTELENGKDLFYVVKAVDKANNASAAATEAKAHPTTKPVLVEPETLHSDGAELRWTPYNTAVDGAFDRFEVHRSATAGFSPSSTTLLATIRDAGATTYRDTTARAGATFTYKLTTNGSPSGEWTVTLPAEGQGRKRVQPDSQFGRATYIREGTCANRGGDTAVRVGATTTSRVRGLVAFDLRDVPASATVSNATISLYAQTPAASALGVSAHPATASWLEGTGRGTCSGDGATWAEIQGGVPWKTAGGDFEATATSSVSRLAGSAPGWDTFDVTALAGRWVAGQQPNHGVLLKAVDETLGDGRLVTYHGDGANTPATLRPRLTLDYTDGSKPQGPTAEISSHGAGERVSGSAVKVAANAADDRRVDKVQFFDGATSITTDTSAPFEATWNTNGVANGTHTLKAVATDDAGNVGNSATVDVSVANSAPPTATVAADPKTYVNTVKADSPAGYYRLNEAAGATVMSDSSGNGRNGAYVGTNHLGQAGMTGDGDTAVKVPSTVYGYPALPGLSTAGATSSQAITVETWYDHKAVAADSTYDNIIERGWGYDGSWNGNPGRWVLFTTVWSGVPHACFTLAVSTGVQKGACAKVAAGRVHLAGTYDGQTVRLFVDGALRASDEVPGVTLNTTTEIRMGHSATQDMTIDDVAIYNAALSPARLQAHYEAAGVPSYVNSVKAHGPAGYWRFGESAGATALADASGANRGATVSGASTLGQQPLIARAGTDGALRVADDPFGDGKATVTGLGGLMGSKFSAEAWVDFAGASTADHHQTVMSRGWGSAGGWRVVLAQAADGAGEQFVRFQVMDEWNYVATAQAAVTPGRVHLVATYDAATSEQLIYVDGDRAGEEWYGIPPTSTAPLEIGGGLDSGEIVIDEAAVFDKVLTGAQVAQHHAIGQGRGLEGADKVTATATDDGTVANVEFLLDGKTFATVTAPPYEASLPTPAAADPAYDGTHVLTTKSTDNHGQVTTSAPLNVVVSNSKPSQRAEVTSTEVPDLVMWDPGATATQETQAVDVAVSNAGDAPLKAADTDLRYRWVRPDGTTASTGDKPLSADVAPGNGVKTRVTVPPPALLAGVQKAKHQLQFDLVDKKSGAVLSNKGNRPKDNPVEVERKTEIGLGLERYYHYEGEQLGSGMQHIVNLASGNSLVRYTPFDTPGRGLNTVVDLTYNSLEDKSRSPAGNNFSLTISGLTPLGMQLDPHPNKADQIGGKSNKYVEVVDADGTRHVFDGKQAADGSTYWEEPPGVHLYLRVFSTTDKTRKWALTRPDRVTFFFDEDGFPTSVEDRNGNRITYRLEATPPGEDPGSPKKRITAVTDAGGHAFAISYFSKAEQKQAHVRGKIKRITDHSGSPLDFEYYDDGNLRRLVQRGGTTNAGTPAQGITVNDRAWVFTYTTSNGDGPALSAAQRSNPPEKVGNQSSRLFSVRDPRGNESTFTYLGSGHGNDRWKLASRTDRAGLTVGYAYDTVNRVTTMTKPLSRVTKYAFDGEGKVTQITNPKNELTKVTWTADRHVQKVTDPHLSTTTSPPAREFTYNDNGYLLTVKNQAAEVNCITHQNIAVDGNDVSGKWKAGRTIPHISQAKTKTTPKGCASATLGDYETIFDYDAKGNLIKVTDQEGHFEQTQWRTDGTVSKTISPKLRETQYNLYDANGMPTEIVDPKGQKTRLGFDTDGLLRWVQDPNHQNDSGTEVEFKTFHFYDAFHRASRTSSPKSTQHERKQLIWAGVEYDANDNATVKIQPHYGQAWTGAGARTTTRFDTMDRPDLVTMPDKSADTAGERITIAYDAAGRIWKRTLPRGVQSSVADDFMDIYEYDVLDRVVTQKRYDVSSAGAILKTIQAHRCFETDGDLKSITQPRANQTSPNCDATGVPYRTTFDYDAAHRQTKIINPLGQIDSTTYDANGNVTSHVDRKKAKTELFYDERDLMIKRVQAHDHDKTTGATTRAITSLTEYDPARNVSAQISPRAFDAAGGVGPWDTKDYVTRHTYDELERLSKTEQPNKAGETKTYVHRTYDPNGNQLTVSQPVTNATSAAVEDRENRTFFDPGWVRTSQQGSPTPVPPRQPTVDPLVRFDYSAEGWATLRVPDKPGGGADDAKKTTWEYFVDGQVKAQHDRGGQITKYGYDAHDNITSMVVTRSTKPTEPIMTMNSTYDFMDRQQRVKQRKQGETNWKATAFSYDEHGNLTQRFEDIEESDAGTQVKAGRRHDFVNYDQLDRLVEQIDYGTDLQTTTKDDRQIRWTYNEVDMPLTRVQRERDMAAAGAPFTKDVQTNSWDYTSSNRRKKVETKNHLGTVLESHTVGYTATENGRSVYLNGNKATDAFTRKGPDATMPCQSASCSNTYGYDGRDRMTSDARTRGASTSTTDFKLSHAGNLEEQGSTPSGGSRSIQKQFTYSSNNQIQTGSQNGGPQQKYHYKDSNLDCITSSSGSANDCSPAGGQSGGANLVEDYQHDPLGRMEAFRSYSGGTATTSSTYTHDALDRQTEQTTTRGSQSDTTKSSFIGLSSAASQEQSSGSQGSRTRSYSYDASGQKLGMSDSSGGQNGESRQYGYGQDADGNVSQLINQSAAGGTGNNTGQGQPQASYGYGAYGDSEQSTTKENDPVTGSATTDQNPLNAYRFEGRKYDTASKSLEMGARRYSPGTSHFIQQDFFESAVSDMGLSQDPLTSNRYSFEGANPVNFVEVDGHGLIDDIEEGAEDVKDTVEDGAESVRNKARDTSRNVRKKVSETASDAKKTVGNAVGDAADKAGETARSVGDKAGDVAGDVKETAGNVANDIKQGAESAGKGIASGVKKASDAVGKANKYAGTANSVLGGAAGVVGKVADKAPGAIRRWSKGKISPKGLSKGAKKVGAISKKAGLAGAAVGFASDFAGRVAGGENVGSALWESTKKSGGSALGSAAGGLAGRGVGMAAGAVVGSIVPGAGTAAGAAIGGAIGTAVGSVVGGSELADEGEEVIQDAGEAVEDVGDSLGL